MKLAIALSIVIGLMVFAVTVLILWTANIFKHGRDSKVPFVERLKAVALSILAGILSGGLIFLAFYDTEPIYIETEEALSRSNRRDAPRPFYRFPSRCIRETYPEDYLDRGCG